MLTFLDPIYIFSFILFHTFILRSTLALPIIIHKDRLASLLHYRDYTSLQISDGFGGNALEEAKSVFEEPLRGVPLVDVPYSIYERLLAMWEAIEYASILSYPDALAQARRNSDDVQVRALLIGMNKNEVLMRMSQTQIFRIKIAKDASQGKDTEDSEWILDEIEERLMAAVEEDRRNSGSASQPVQLEYPL